jgi:DNA invertase Pin-like site-specific DNA recombinase
MQRMGFQQVDGQFVSYLRVSTDRQGRSGLGIEAQRRAVEDYLNGGSWRLLDEFVELESGKRSDRPELAKALAACRKRKATLVIARLDRLSRKVHFISGLMESGVPFVACDRPNARPFELHIYAAMAEEETRATSARTKAALAAAKARGVRLGNPTNLEQAARKGSASNRERARQWALNIMPVIEHIRVSGITSLDGIAREMNARGVKTARGGEWHKTTVLRVLAAAASEAPSTPAAEPIDRTPLGSRW